MRDMLTGVLDGGFPWIPFMCFVCLDMVGLITSSRSLEQSMPFSLSMEGKGFLSGYSMYVVHRQRWADGRQTCVKSVLGGSNDKKSFWHESFSNHECSTVCDHAFLLLGGWES